MGIQIADIGIEAAFASALGANIEAKRKQRQIHQQALAADIGVHRNTLMRWESGESMPSPWELLRLADMLGCNYIHLLPSREHTWGRDLRPMMRERDPVRGAQLERDARISA